MTHVPADSAATPVDPDTAAMSVPAASLAERIGRQAENHVDAPEPLDIDDLD